MKATLLLCDYAVVAEGKLFVSGGGWSIIGPNVKGYIALLIAVPWDRANRRVHFELALLNEDGDAVTGPDLVGNEVPVTLSAQLEVGRPAGLLRGVSLDVPLAIEMPPMVLAAGKRFEWILTIDGESKEDWRLPFMVRPLPAGPQEAGPPPRH